MARCSLIRACPLALFTLELMIIWLVTLVSSHPKALAPWANGHHWSLWWLSDLVFAKACGSVHIYQSVFVCRWYSGEIEKVLGAQDFVARDLSHLPYHAFKQDFSEIYRTLNEDYTGAHCHFFFCPRYFMPLSCITLSWPMAIEFLPLIFTH